MPKRTLKTVLHERQDIEEVALSRAIEPHERRERLQIDDRAVDALVVGDLDLPYPWNHGFAPDRYPTIEWPGDV